MHLQALPNSTLVKKISISRWWAKLEREIQEAESPVSKYYRRLDSNNEEEIDCQHRASGYWRRC